CARYADGSNYFDYG
nr:immunoglobulin heavy chain junction region [Macaca mulatta]